MALAGALIVFSGLIVLSFAIAQLHKLLKLLDKKREEVPAPPPVPVAQAQDTIDVLSDPVALAESYQPLAEELGETFPLADLYALAMRDDLPHPHLSIKALRDAQCLASQGEGVFKWQASGST
jgi:hypothetical protein